MLAEFLRVWQFQACVDSFLAAVNPVSLSCLIFNVCLPPNLNWPNSAHQELSHRARKFPRWGSSRVDFKLKHMEYSESGLTACGRFRAARMAPRAIRTCSILLTQSRPHSGSEDAVAYEFKLKCLAVLANFTADEIQGAIDFRMSDRSEDCSILLKSLRVEDESFKKLRAYNAGINHAINKVFRDTEQKIRNCRTQQLDRQHSHIYHN